MKSPFSNITATVFIAAGVIIAGCHPGAGAGRKGNAKFKQGEYEEAVSSYGAGIDKLLTRSDEEPRGEILSSLLNNAGAGLMMQEKGSEARDNFVASVNASTSNGERSRGYYNAGFTAYADSQKQLSADYFKRSLLQEPDNADAKFNYELVMRELKKENQNKQDGSQGSPPPPPSAYAKELKARAEELVRQRQYADAHQLMEDGLTVDPSVKAFQEFIDRIGSVAEINQ